MSKLANEIYRLLLRRLRTRKPSISYSELADQVSRKIPTHRRSAKFHAALGEVTVTCRRHKLPAIAAIVWRRDTSRPSDGYFIVAHPKLSSDSGRIAAWEVEHDRVVRAAAKFPSRL